MKSTVAIFGERPELALIHAAPLAPRTKLSRHTAGGSLGMHGKSYGPPITEGRMLQCTLHTASTRTTKGHSATQGWAIGRVQLPPTRWATQLGANQAAEMALSHARAGRRVP